MLQRGFKSQCERRSAELRRSLGLLPAAPLSAGEYARRLEVTVWTDKDLSELSEEDRRQLTILDPESWSGFVIRIRQRHLVVINSAQILPRQNSVLMHELSHIVLGHELSSVGVTESGHLVPTIYNQDQEDEANWLAGTLLLPRPALLEIRRGKLTDVDAMHQFMVSQEMLNWRFRMTGVDYQFANAQKRRFG